MSTAYLFRGREVEELVDPSDWVASRRRRSLLWVDVDDPDDVPEAVGAILDPDLARRLVQHRPEKAGFDDCGDFLEVRLRAPDGEQREPATLRLLVARAWVVTIHDRRIAAIEELRNHVGGGGATGTLDGPAFLAMLLEWMLAAYEEAFDGIERDLERIDVEAMKTGELVLENHLERLVALRAEVGGLRRSLVQHRTVLASLSHPELVDVGGEEAARRFADLRERFREAIDAARDARESVFNSFDVLIARTEQRTNEIVKLLTIFSFLLLPGSLVAGLLGMNFDVWVFDWDWLFWVVLIGFAVFVTMTVLVARARRWL